MTRVLVLLLVLVLSAAAQTPRRRPARKPAPAPPPAAPAPADRWRLDAVGVEGNRLYGAEKILDAAGLKAGQMAGRTDFEAARDRLLQSGFFESVAYRFDPVPNRNAIRGSFQVAEIAQVYPWRIDDLPVTADEFRKALAPEEPLLAEQLPASDRLLKRFTAKLESLAALKGFKEPCAVRLVSEKASEIVLVFRPRADPPAIAEVHFTGNKVWSESDLRRQIGNLAIGARYAESRFREFLETTIRPMYELRGRLRARFLEIKAAPAEGGVRGLSVTVTVDEGEPFQLSSVTVTGTPFSPQEAQKIAQFQIGDPANFGDIGQRFDRILQALKDNGYLKPESGATRKVNDEAKTVDVFFDVSPGIQYMFGKLEVKGLDILSEPVVRKLWALKPGEPMRASYPQMFLNRVREDGYFDNLGAIRFELRTNENSRTADVVLHFAGGAAPKRPE